MDDTAILGHLEELAQKLGVQIRYECLADNAAFSRGGLCRVRGKHLIIINENTSVREKVQTMARALSRFDLRQIYLRPVLRALLEKAAEKEGGATKT